MPEEILFDARELEAPLPLTLALNHANNLQKNQYVKMIHRMKPCHLFAMLEKLGFWSYDFEFENSHIIFMAKDEHSIENVKKVIQNEYNRTIA